MIGAEQGISSFFEDTLGANLSNPRWAWGATNPFTAQVFLRVWADEIEIVQGVECVAILGEDWTSGAPGLPERRRHVDMLKAGAQGYGVVCVALNPNAPGPRRIAGFDSTTMLELGGLVSMPNTLYAQIRARVLVADIASRQSSESTLVPDLKSILSRRDVVTTREALVDARVGQGIFRAQVLSLWNRQCCVSGCATVEAIRASRIKPWRECSDEERLDPLNGLPLVATLDALFDAGLIAFSDDGSMLVAASLRPTDHAVLGVGNLRLRRSIAGNTRHYLEFHRDTYFAG